MKVTGKHEFKSVPLINTSDKLVGNHLAGTDPTSSDDSSAGYHVGYTWRNTTSGKFFKCIDDTVGAAIWLDTESVLADLQTQINAIAPNTENILLSGSVSYSGVGLIYDVTACNYRIQGVSYSSVADDVTLAAADPTNDRIDVIYVDNAGLVGVLTGVPDPSPSKPTIDPLTQLEVTFITVPAGAVAPTILFENVYLENTEWTSSSNLCTADFNSTIDPYSGTKSVNVSAFATNGATNSFIKFIKGSSYTIPASFNLKFRIKILTTSWTTTARRLGIQFRNGGATIHASTANLGGSATSTYGFNPSSVGIWQNVVVPYTAFGAFTSAVMDEVRFYKNATAAGTMEFRIDDVKIEDADIFIPSTSVDAFDVTYTPTVSLNWVGIPVTAGEALDNLASTRANKTITLTAGEGISGGGTLAANRTFALDFSDLSVTDTNVNLTDLVSIHDGAQKKITFANFQTSIIHSSLSGYVANEHIDHTTVSISAGTGLTGGGTIAANRTISLNIPGLTNLTDAGVLASGDSFAVYNTSAAEHEEATMAQLLTFISNNLTGYAKVGTYTNNYIPKWNAVTNTLANSIIYDDGTNIGINTGSTNSLHKVWVNSGSTSPGSNITSAVYGHREGVQNNRNIGIYGRGLESANVSFGTLGHAGSGNLSGTGFVSGEVIGAYGEGAENGFTNYGMAAVARTTNTSNNIGLYISVANSSLNNYLGQWNSPSLGNWKIPFALPGGSGYVDWRDIDDLTADATPDGAADYVMTYDASVGEHKKVLLNNLPGLTDLLYDTTPQLGGNLDVNSFKITSVSNGNIDIEPNGTGNVLLGNFTFDADQSVGAGQDNYVLTYDNATGLISLEAATGGVTDHGALTGLSDDDHSIYALLAGRAGGQTLIGGTAASENLTLNSTSNATKGLVQMVTGGGHVTIGGASTASELRFLEPSGSGINYTAFKAQAQAGNITYTLPAADGSSGHVLQTNGSGTLSWTAQTGGAGGGWTVVTEAGASRSATNGEFVLINAASCIVTLPTPTSGHRVGVKMIFGTVTAISVKTQSGDKIDGTVRDTTGLGIYNQWDAYTFVADGTDWFIEA